MVGEEQLGRRLSFSDSGATEEEEEEGSINIFKDFRNNRQKF